MTAENLPAVPADIHYEVAIDPEPDTGAEPELVDQLPVPSVTRLPVIPAHLQTIDGIRAAARYHAELHWHRARFHGLRLPRYALLCAGWAAVGIVRVAGRQLAWWWVAEQQPLRSDAVIDGDSREWMKLHREAKEDRRVRGMVLGGEAVAVAVAVGILVKLGLWWADAAAAAVVLPLLARAGRPADQPILSSATVTGRFRRINADVVARAYYVAGLGHPEKEGQQIGFPSRMDRDGEGSRVLVDLPYGKTLKDAMDARDKIASGLDVTESQVFIHRDPSSTRRHVLWVADRDPLAVPVGRTPLLACKATDIWKAAPLGLDERGQLVRVPLLWQSVLVSALPRQGKTFSSRLLGLYCALDPFVLLDVFDFKGSPDWRKFALVADSFAFGLTPTRYGMPLQIFGDRLEAIKADVADRYHRLSELQEKDSALCPEGKLTRAIARDPRYRMPVRVLIMDEFQEVYDLGEASKEVAPLLTHLIKVAPGAGVIIIGSTQRPSGVGSGQVASQFTSFRDNFAVRFGLRTSSWQVSELCLGAGAYSEGLDTSVLLPQYKGVGILRGASDASPTVRTYLADGQDAERILTAARGLRERAGTLSGMALGESLPKDETSVLADVLAVLGDVPGMHWQAIAPLLAARFPDRHADCTPESVSAQCRAAGVDSVQVKYLGRNANGCRRDDVQRASQQASR